MPRAHNVGELVSTVVEVKSHLSRTCPEGNEQGEYSLTYAAVSPRSGEEDEKNTGELIRFNLYK